MNDLNSERRILRRQIRDDVLNSIRKRRDEAQPDLGTAVIRALVCQFLAGKSVLGDAGPTAEHVAQKIYGKSAGGYIVTRAAADLPGFLARTAQGPATITTSGYAAELAISTNWPTLRGALAPASTYAALAARGLRETFNGVATVKIPSKLPTPLCGGDFVLEGGAIPTRRLGLRRSRSARRANWRRSRISATNCAAPASPRSRRCFSKASRTTPRRCSISACLTMPRLRRPGRRDC
jgi:hypothetical protein